MRAARSGLEQHSARLVQECPSRRRQLHAAPGAVEQGDAKLPLEVADLLAQWRLRDVEARRRTAEVQLLGDGHEVPEVTKLHRIELYPIRLNRPIAMYWTGQEPP